MQDHSCAQVLSELKEYAQEVDVDFVRKSVRAVGRCAIKVDASADRCVTALLDLIQLNSADGGIGNRYLNCESTNYASSKVHNPQLHVIN